MNQATDETKRALLTAKRDQILLQAYEQEVNAILNEAQLPLLQGTEKQAQEKAIRKNREDSRLLYAAAAKASELLDALPVADSTTVVSGA